MKMEISILGIKIEYYERELKEAQDESSQLRYLLEEQGRKSKGSSPEKIVRHLQ